MVNVAVELRARPHTARGDGVHAAARAHDKAVHNAEAADADECVDDGADGLAEDV